MDIGILPKQYFVVRVLSKSGSVRADIGSKIFAHLEHAQHHIKTQALAGVQCELWTSGVVAWKKLDLNSGEDNAQM